jgi:hypothetical protein
MFRIRVRAISTNIHTLRNPNQLNNATIKTDSIHVSIHNLIHDFIVNIYQIYKIYSLIEHIFLLHFDFFKIKLKWNSCSMLSSHLFNKHAAIQEAAVRGVRSQV